ncbi:MAG: flagellar basal body rod protein [Spartobacteria bacterium]|nr:flagellar basal body rod protein [Spartobacteria bacterium]
MYDASISAINAASLRMDVSAHNMANLNTEDALAQRVSLSEQYRQGGVRADVYTSTARPDLLTETVEQLAVDHYLQGNIEAVRAQDEMTGSIIDLLA